MPKLIAIVVLSLLAGFSIATWRIDSAGDEAGANGDVSEAPLRSGAAAGVFERVQVLEDAVRDERQARQLLEDELAFIYEVLDSLERPQNQDATGGTEDRRSRRVGEDMPADRRDDDARRRQALADAGFSESRADWIMQRESELRMQAMQARYEAMRSNEEWNAGSWSTMQDNLRAEIGDAEYEMYLEAGNRPTSIGVRDVLQASPALSAGLQPGDRITHYDGERVYSIYEMRRLQAQGEPGQSVVVSFVRGGTPMQVLLPRGPMGITTSRRR